MGEKLAINGGDPAVTIGDPERWRRPIDEELRLVSALLKEGAISGSGKGLPKEFEEDFRKYTGAEYCLTTDHGSSALASAFYAAGVGPGDEVIVPTAGYIGSYAGALHMGARPVFCDIDPDTLLIDPEDAEERITHRTRAIVPIHYRGNLCDMDALMEVGRRHGVAIIEDAAHAHGSEWDGEKTGNLGDMTCFSLQGVGTGGKPVSGGEGGIVTTNSRELYERQLIFCHLHRSGITEELSNPAYRMFEKEVLGQKWRAHPLALAIAKVSLGTLDSRIEMSERVRVRIFDALDELPGLQPERSYPKAKRIQLYGGLQFVHQPDELDGLSTQRLLEALRAEGIPVRGPGFDHLQHLKPIYRRGFDLWGHGRGPLSGAFMGLPPYRAYSSGDFPVAEDLNRRTFNLPCYIDPKPGFIDQLLDGFRKVISNHAAVP